MSRLEFLFILFCIQGVLFGACLEIAHSFHPAQAFIITVLCGGGACCAIGLLRYAGLVSPLKATTKANG